jgi:hypothetical protein
VFTSETLKQIVKGLYKIYSYAKRPWFPITYKILSKITEDKPQLINNLNLDIVYLFSFATFLQSREIIYNSNNKPYLE